MLEFENITSFPICLTYKLGGVETVFTVIRSHSKIAISDDVFNNCRDCILRHIQSRELIPIPAEPADRDEPLDQPIEQTPAGTFGGRKLG